MATKVIESEATETSTTLLYMYIHIYIYISQLRRQHKSFIK